MDAVNEANRDAYMTRAVVMLSVGADAMGASGVTTLATVVVVGRAVRITVTGPAMTATSPPSDSWGNIVGGAS